MRKFLAVLSNLTCLTSKTRNPAFRKSRKTGVQLLRSVICSALGFGADALIIFLLVEFAGFHYLASNAVSFIIGSTVVYVLSRIWAFPLPRHRKRRIEYLVFLALAAIGLLLNSLLMWAMVDGIGVWYLAGKTMSAIIVFVYNFACRKFIVFRQKRTLDENETKRPIGLKPKEPLMQKSKFFNGRNTAICAVIFIVLMILIQGPWIGAGAVAAASPGAVIPDMRFSYAHEDLQPMFESLGENGRAAYLTMNAVDFFFAAAYGLLYLIALGWIAMRLFPRAQALRFIGLLGLLGALADETENVIFRLMATGSLDSGSSLSRIAAIASPVKYSCVYASMALLVAGLVAVAVKAIAGRRNKSA